MLKMAIPQWKIVSRHTIRNDSFKVYEVEKNKLKEKLKNVERISLTTDLWRSKPQKIEYMEWDIENKVFTVSVDNASANDSCIQIMKETFSLTKRLICGGSEYPTSNLFLSEIYRIKFLLDTSSESSDDFVKGMVTNMKERFDKYWGECNLLMAIGAILDPRLKMKVIEITFPKMFSSDVVREDIHKVRETLYELYDEYVNLYSPPLMEQVGECETSANVCGGRTGSTPGLLEILQAVRSEELTGNKQSEVDFYLEEGCYIPQERDWCRSLHGLKRKNKKIDEDQPKEIILPAL
ncbi:hypothetical protein HRI_004729800 [Hibiscus trionum]|uniref:hAT-like transposase RNase-H fold domain-containing protein n=1 Tax=Hibiscus trionum TaxID=183268 RepID=A0A9W7J9T5_HIBTR|nr:hypothetical protein HRI_004729800 [Hibiscus trionum]